MNGEYAQPQHISDAIYLGAAIVLSIIGIVGFIFNTCVIFIMIRDTRLWTPQNVIIFNLATSDLAVSVLGNPVTLAAAITKGWIFGQTICVIYGFFMALFGIASITTLTVLAYDRYLMIRYPFSSSRLTKETALYAIAGIWIYAFAVTGPPLFGWNRYVNESANISCSIDWESGEHSNYVIYIFVFGLFLPVTVIIYSYVSLVVTVRKRAAEKIIGQATKAECRVAIMVAVMILAFLTAWMPYSVLALMIAFGGVHISPVVSIIPALCAKSSICWNPIIYIGLNTQFRSAWKRFLNIQDTLSEVSLDADITTGMTKLMTGHQELPAHPMNNGDASHPPGLIMCCLAHDEHRQSATYADRYECNLEMKSCNPQTLGRRPETDIGDVSL
ncbi:rhodopsin-like [Acyrthosiphon pisum]|uniref:G-protein coupled receptors family 1 profile domain-containing protein n=1 Tax=Acyrthosiphon pisum TaxID=7029 RepID=A0A8R2JSW8_ACYPI|nr:rhodopsin-like [Acyrthosiphon pisum]